MKEKKNVWNEKLNQPDTNNDCRAKNVEYKILDTVQYMNKKESNKYLERKMHENLEENNKLFWKEVDKNRRKVCVKSESVVDKCGRILVTMCCTLYRAGEQKWV